MDFDYNFYLKLILLLFTFFLTYWFREKNMKKKD
jgi:hypothetical protein